jgi:hypothetical protein
MMLSEGLDLIRIPIVQASDLMGLAPRRITMLPENESNQGPYTNKTNNTNNDRAFWR